MKMSANPETIGLKEAANFLGFTGVCHLREKAKAGKIPGAFKISNRWMFLKDELIIFVRDFHKTLHNEIVPNGASWQSAKRKIVPITTRASQSLESECRNQLDALQKSTRRNMRRNAEGK